jgi:NAD(P)-dependent dehydrogenase (short-subunit alcohol dehydrogenase family)
MFTTVFSITEDNEKTITTNVVSTFLLVMLLIPKLRHSAEKLGTMPRIVIPNSALHYLAPLKELDVKEGNIFATLNDPKMADVGDHYPLSKLVVIYAVRELADQIKASRKAVVVINTNTSYCQSELLLANDSFGVRMGAKLLARSTEMGSCALVHGILSGVESQGHI